MLDTAGDSQHPWSIERKHWKSLALVCLLLDVFKVQFPNELIKIIVNTIFSRYLNVFELFSSLNKMW